MNKLVVAAVSGVLLSFIVALVVVYITTYYYSVLPNPIKFPKTENETIIRNNSIAPAYVLALSNNSYKSETAVLASLPINITKNITFWLNKSPQFIYNSSIKYDVFYVQPSFIITKPNSTVSFILYFNKTYYNIYNDPVYTDQLGNLVRVINVTPLKLSNTTLAVYKVNLYIGNVNQNTIIILPIWDTKLLEIQYIIILVY